MEKTNKTKEILKYLQDDENKEHSITSMQAIDMFGATRLSAIIFNLRKHYDIETIEMVCNDRYGHECHFAKYVYRGVREDG